MQGAISISANPEIIRLTSASQVKDLEDDWLRLAARVPGTSFFLTPDWVLSWWETIGGKPYTELAVWRDASGALAALVFLSRISQRIHPRVPPAWPVWTVTGSGVGFADHVGWPVSSTHREAVRRYVRHRTNGSTLLLQDLDPEAGLPFVPPGAHLLSRNPNPRLALLQEDLPRRVRKVRSNVRRYEKRARAAGITFRWIGAHEMDGRFIERLFELHSRRMVQKGVETAFASTRDFQRRLITRATDDRGPMALVAEREHRIVGILYLMKWRDTLAHYQGGWLPEMAPFRLGTQLLIEAIERSAKDGVRTLDLLRGNEEYKYYLGGVDRWDETWIVPGGLSGQLLKVLVPAYRYVTQRAWAPQDSEVIT